MLESTTYSLRNKSTPNDNKPEKKTAVNASILHNFYTNNFYRTVYVFWLWVLPLFTLSSLLPGCMSLTVLPAGRNTLLSEQSGSNSATHVYFINIHTLLTSVLTQQVSCSGYSFRAVTQIETANSMTKMSLTTAVGITNL
jgi:hypothetical protein